MRFPQALKERYKQRRIKKYVLMLLSKKIRLQEIPYSLLRDLDSCFELYITAFRADRGISRSQYEADYYFLEVEIALANTAKNLTLKNALEDIKDHVHWYLEVD